MYTRCTFRRIFAVVFHSLRVARAGGHELKFELYVLPTAGKGGAFPWPFHSTAMLRQSWDKHFPPVYLSSRLQPSDNLQSLLEGQATADSLLGGVCRATRVGACRGTHNQQCHSSCRRLPADFRCFVGG